MFKIFKKSRILYHIVLGLFIIAMTTMAVCDSALAAAGGNTLYPGESLARGQSLTSTDGRFVLTHQTDGNVVLSKQGTATWHTHTYGQATTALVMQGDGNLVLYNGSSAVWHTYTWTSGPSRLVVQSDGNAVLFATGNNTVSWSTGTHGATNTMYPGESLTPGQSLKSADGRFDLVHQTDGNLVLYKQGGIAIWSSGTNGDITTTLVLQGDGNLVLYNGSSAVWHTQTWSSGPSKLIVPNNGDVALYVISNNTVSWSTGTNEYTPDHMLSLVSTEMPGDVFSAFIKSVEVVDSGNSGFPYFLVVNVDPYKVADYEVKESDPYWLKYYCSMWEDGQFASAHAPADPGYYMQMYFNSPSDYINNPRRTNGIPSGGFERILDFKWAANHDNGIDMTHYRKNLIINPSLSFRPAETTFYDGKLTGTYVPYPTEGNGFFNIYMLMRIYTGAETVVAGEVTESGWGMVPMAATYTDTPYNCKIPYSPWVIIKPYDKEISFTQQSGKAWVDIASAENVKPIEWEGSIVESGSIDDARMAMLTNYLAMDMAGLVTASFGADLNSSSMSFGGVIKPDYEYDGKHFLVEGKMANGQLLTYAVPITDAEAIQYGKQYGVVNVNGSMNTLEESLQNYAMISAYTGQQRGVVTYMAQNFQYQFADENAIRSSLTSLVNNVIADGTQVEIITHSWSGHIALDLFGDNPDVTIDLFNPAHGNFPEGGMAAFRGDLLVAQAQVNLFCGTEDLVSQGFGGCDQASINACINNVYDMCTVYDIPDSGHPVIDMLLNGAANYLDFGRAPR